MSSACLQNEDPAQDYAFTNQPMLRRLQDWLFLQILPLFTYAVVKLVCRTYRVKILGITKDQLRRYRTGLPCVYASWHQRMFFFHHYFGRFYGDHGPVMMISQSRDGEFATRCAHLFGFSAVRGSSSARGSRALRELMAQVKAGKAAGMMVDGPRGPGWVVKMGTLMLGRDTGVPLIPVVCAARSKWILGGWDHFIVPQPFTRVVVIFGPPLYVPATARGSELEKYRQQFEQRLRQITIQADCLCGQVVYPRGYQTNSCHLSSAQSTNSDSTKIMA